MPPGVALVSDDSDDGGDGDDDDGTGDNSTRTTTEASVAAGKGAIALLLTAVVVADDEIVSPGQLPKRTNKHRSWWLSLDTWRRSRAIVRVALRLDHLW